MTSATTGAVQTAPADAGGEDDDLAQLDALHLHALRTVLRLPSRYTQRVVERLSFLPRGGERWHRDVQLRLPPIDPPPEDGRFVVSLGMFRRRRFPDFEVRDAEGRRLNLLTRRQHQHCMAMTMLRQYLSEGDWDRATEIALPEFQSLYHAIAMLIADIKDEGELTSGEAKLRLKRVLERLEKSAAEIDRATQLLQSDCDLLETHTHYLCWVSARPGETVTLTASYTMSDTVRLAGHPRKSTDADTAQVNWLTRARMRLWARLNLNPVFYELRAPAHDHTGSYYLTIDPPEESHVSFLDWGRDYCFGASTADVDCAHSACHIHNGEQSVDDGNEFEPESIRGSQVSALIKADPVDHALLAAVAVLNAALAFLAQDGVISPGGTTGQAQWLLLAPAVVVALIAQHRRRYYSQVTRPVRAIMWGYLALNGLFAVSVAFDVSLLNRVEDYVSAAMACLSAGLVVLIGLSGDAYERTTRLWHDRWRSQEREAKGEESSRDAYLRVARRYGDLSALAIVGIVVALAVAMVASNWGAGRRADEDVRAARQERSTPPAPERRPPAAAPAKDEPGEDGPRKDAPVTDPSGAPRSPS